MSAAKELISLITDNMYYARPEDIQKLIAALECAMEGLEYYASAGSLTAEERIDEINQICSQGE